MEAIDISITDLRRILIGEVPGFFLLEIILRTFFVYLLLMVSMRMMGKRMASQLNRNEMAALVTIAAAIGIPIQAPERGLLPAVIIAGVVVVVQQYISRRAARNEHFEQISQDELSVLVKDGVMMVDNMKHSRITRERLLSALRVKGIKNLKMVRRLYIEAGGAFTLVRSEEMQPGLATIPDNDKEMLDKLHKTGEDVCSFCGETKQKSASGKCGNCKSRHWRKAIINQ
jgi:uncharacterized membrane protein YcaP (DUF421 family)